MEIQRGCLLDGRDRGLQTVDAIDDGARVLAPRIALRRLVLSGRPINIDDRGQRLVDQWLHGERSILLLSVVAICDALYFHGVAVHSQEKRRRFTFTKYWRS